MPASFVLGLAVGVVGVLAFRGGSPEPEVEGSVALERRLRALEAENRKLRAELEVRAQVPDEVASGKPDHPVDSVAAPSETSPDAESRVRARIDYMRKLLRPTSPLEEWALADMVDEIEIDGGVGVGALSDDAARTFWPYHLEYARDYLALSEERDAAKDMTANMKITREMQGRHFRYRRDAWRHLPADVYLRLGWKSR
jgi:hypothetical protein